MKRRKRLEDVRLDIVPEGFEEFHIKSICVWAFAEAH